MNLSEKISLILVDKGFSLSPKKNTEDLINSGTEFHKSNEDIKIAEQHGIADQIFILLKGEAEYVKYHNNCLLYTSPSPRDGIGSRMPSSA